MELYICVFQIWKRTDIFKSFLLKSFCMYSIMVHFFSMRIFFCICILDHCSYTFILKEKKLKVMPFRPVLLLLFSECYPGFKVLIGATPNKSVCCVAGRYPRREEPEKEASAFSLGKKVLSRGRLRSFLLCLRNLRISFTYPDLYLVLENLFVFSKDINDSLRDSFNSQALPVYALMVCI